MHQSIVFIVASVVYFVDLVDLASKLYKDVFCALSAICIPLLAIFCLEIEQRITIVTVQEVHSACWHHEMQESVTVLVFLQNDIVVAISVHILNELSLGCILVGEGSHQVCLRAVQ